ncbi:TPA: hypothetical protein RFW12_005806 [Klebsiella variicola]|nr:hypothetical protein [Klebsiella variicola]
MMSIYRFTGAIFAVFFISSCNMKAKATENDNASLKDEYSLMNAGGEAVTWVTDIPIEPKRLVGRVVILKNIGKPEPLTISAKLPVEEKNDSVITKSIIKKVGATGSVGLGNIFSIAASAETAVEFQVVQGSRWVTDTSSDEYYQGLKNFLERAGDIKQYDEVYMVQGVIQRKIWLKKYNKADAKAELTYFVKINGTLYGTNSDYEEVSQYGILYIPLVLKKSGIDVTRLNLSTENKVLAKEKVSDFNAEVNDIKLPSATLVNLPSTVYDLDKNSSFIISGNDNIKNLNGDVKGLSNEMLNSKIKEFNDNNIKINH